MTPSYILYICICMPDLLVAVLEQRKWLVFRMIHGARIPCFANGQSDFLGIYLHEWTAYIFGLPPTPDAQWFRIAHLRFEWLEHLQTNEFNKLCIHDIRVNGQPVSVWVSSAPRSYANLQFIFDVVVNCQSREPLGCCCWLWCIGSA